MPDYSKGRIYAIRAPGTDECYIGSTTLALSMRMANQRADFKAWKSGKKNYYTSFKLIEREGAYIELIEEFPCESREQLNKREGEVIRATANCVNKYIAGRTLSEYCDDNKEKRNAYAAVYHAAHKEQKNAYCRAWYAAKRTTTNSQSPVECASSETSLLPGAELTAASTAAQ